MQFWSTGWPGWGRHWAAHQQNAKAHALAERIYRIAQEIGKRQTELDGLILLALAFSAQGKTDQALVHLEKALSIGEQGGYIRIFIDEGPPMVRLLHEARKRGVAPGYVRQLLAAFPNAKPVQADPSATQAANVKLIEPLSERELEALQLIDEGLTNREIAARLYLSHNTVKVHTRNIYGKLGVHSRIQAIARSQELGLFQRN